MSNSSRNNASSGYRRRTPARRPDRTLLTCSSNHYSAAGQPQAPSATSTRTRSEWSRT